MAGISHILEAFLLHHSRLIFWRNKSQCDLICKQILSRITVLYPHTAIPPVVVMRDIVFKAEPQQSGLCFHGLKCPDKDLILLLRC